MTPLKDYLEKNNVSIYKLAKESNMAYSTIFKAANRENIESITIRILKGISKVTGKNIGQVVNELIESEEEG
jgi:predicted transcriptional regulator